MPSISSLTKKKYTPSIWRHFPYARLEDFHDGDTCEVIIDQGFGGKQNVSIRLLGLSAPETSGLEKTMGEQALATARYISYLLSDSKPKCELWTWKPSFNRYVGIVKIEGVDTGRNILSKGMARAWDGKTPRPPFIEFPIVNIEEELRIYDSILKRDAKDV